MRTLLPALLIMTLFAGRIEQCCAADDVEKKDPSAIVNDRLGRVLADLKFDAVGIADVLNFVSDATEVDLFVDWRRLDGVKVVRTTPVSCNLQGQKFSDALQEILDTAAKGKMSFQVSGSVVIISTKDGIGTVSDSMKALEAKKLAVADRERLDKQLPEFVFDAISLGDAIDFLEKSSNEKLVIDWDGFKKSGVNRAVSVTMKMRRASLGDAVQLLFVTVTDKPVDVTLEKDGIHIAPGK